MFGQLLAECLREPIQELMRVMADSIRESLPANIIGELSEPPASRIAEPVRCIVSEDQSLN